MLTVHKDRNFQKKTHWKQRNGLQKWGKYIQAAGCNGWYMVVEIDSWAIWAVQNAYPKILPRTNSVPKLKSTWLRSYGLIYILKYSATRLVSYLNPAFLLKVHFWSHSLSLAFFLRETTAGYRGKASSKTCMTSLGMEFSRKCLAKHDILAKPWHLKSDIHFLYFFF